PRAAGLPGAAGLVRRGDINTTVIGPYDAPRVRLPGAGGAPEIARASGRVVGVVRPSPGTFVGRGGVRPRRGRRVVRVHNGPVASLGRVRCRPPLGQRVATVITDIGVLGRDPARGELVL